MKRPTKPLLCVLLALPGFVGAQTANVTLYGLIDAPVRYSNNNDANRASKIELSDGIFTGSRFGLRGTELIASDIRVLFTLEAGFDGGTGASLQANATTDLGQTAAASGRLFGREAHVGLSNGLATFTLGRQYTLAHQISGRFQPHSSPNLAALSVFSSHHVARQDNMAKLDVNAGPMLVSAAYTLGEVAGNTSANAAWAMSAAYSSGPLFAGVYLQQVANVGDTDRRKIVGAGASYAVLPSTTLYAGFMQRRNTVSVQKNRVWTLAAKGDISPALQFSAGYMVDDQSGSTALDGKRSVAFAMVDYLLSKRTDTYLMFDRNNVTGGYTKPAFMGVKGTQNALTVGLRHRF